MLKEAIEYIAQTLASATGFDVAGKKVHDVVYDRPVHRPALPHQDPLAATLKISSLSGLVDYLVDNIDTLDLPTHLLHVASPERVDLVSAAAGFHRQRQRFVSAVYPAAIQPTWFGAYHPVEEVVVALQAQFTPSAGRDALLGLLTAVKGDQTEIREDTGAAQQITVKSGIHLLGTAKVENPYALAPFRSFVETEQVSTPYLVRAKKPDAEVLVMLQPVDGGAWVVESARRIAAKLRELIADRLEITIIH